MMATSASKGVLEMSVIKEEVGGDRLTKISARSSHKSQKSIISNPPENPILIGTSKTVKG
jgi:hypothetical protein